LAEGIPVDAITCAEIVKSAATLGLHLPEFTG